MAASLDGWGGRGQFPGAPLRAPWAVQAEVRARRPSAESCGLVTNRNIQPQSTAVGAQTEPRPNPGAADDAAQRPDSYPTPAPPAGTCGLVTNRNIQRPPTAVGDQTAHRRPTASRRLPSPA